MNRLLSYLLLGFKELRLALLGLGYRPLEVGIGVLSNINGGNIHLR